MSGFFNQIVDLLGGFKFQKFRQLAPDAEAAPAPVHAHLWNIFN